MADIEIVSMYPPMIRINNGNIKIRPVSGEILINDVLLNEVAIGRTMRNAVYLDTIEQAAVEMSIIGLNEANTNSLGLTKDDIKTFKFRRMYFFAAAMQTYLYEHISMMIGWDSRCDWIMIPNGSSDIELSVPTEISPAIIQLAVSHIWLTVSEGVRYQSVDHSENILDVKIENDRRLLFRSNEGKGFTFGFGTHIMGFGVNYLTEISNIKKDSLIGSWSSTGAAITNLADKTGLSGVANLQRLVEYIPFKMYISEQFLDDPLVDAGPAVYYNLISSSYDLELGFTPPIILTNSLGNKVFINNNPAQSKNWGSFKVRNVSLDNDFKVFQMDLVFDTNCSIKGFASNIISSGSLLYPEIPHYIPEVIV